MSAFEGGRDLDMLDEQPRRRGHDWRWFWRNAPLGLLALAAGGAGRDRTGDRKGVNLMVACRLTKASAATATGRGRTAVADLDPTAANPLIHLGANNPPEPIEPTPYDIAKKAVEDVCTEAAQWLDGAVIDNKDMADGIANLLAEIRKAEKLAVATRKAEEDPHDEIVKEIRARYAPLIADTKTIQGKTVIAKAACEAALQPWLLAEQRRIAEAARLAREEADRQRLAAEAALRASDAANIAEREAAEVLLRNARRAEAAANVAGRQTATAGGAMGRAAGLRSTWHAEITDPVVAAHAMWTEARDEMLVFLTDWANRRVREGVRSLPGFAITEEKRAT